MGICPDGSYLVGAVDWICRWSCLVLIWLVQLAGTSLESFGSYLVDAVDWTYRWSYLVLIWLMQLIAYIVRVVWF